MWSLGCVLYEMCMLRHPFVATNMASLVVRILKASFPPLPATRGYSVRVRVPLHGLGAFHRTESGTITALSSTYILPYIHNIHT